MTLAPIILFVYNRPWHTQQTLEALSKNQLADQSVLYVYADGAKENANEDQLKNICEVREIIRSRLWCREVKIIERNKNWGLADNIVDGVTTIVNKYSKIIVLEDDIVTSPGFLKYMNDALSIYESEEKVMHISGYMFPIGKKLSETFFYNTASCWGWGTWKDAWDNLEWNANRSLSRIEKEGLVTKFNVNNTYKFYDDLKANADSKIRTWAVRWYASFFLKGGYALHPYPSLTNNIGHDGEGENCKKTDRFTWKDIASDVPVYRKPVVESLEALRAMEKFNRNKSNLMQRISNNIKILLET